MTALSNLNKQKMDITKIDNPIPGKHFKKITNKSELIEWQNHAKDCCKKGIHPVFGKPKFVKEVPITLFNDDGIKQETSLEYFISTSVGDLYAYRKKKDGTIRKIYGSKTKERRVTLFINKGGESIRLVKPIYTVLLWSLFPDLDWTYSCKSKNSCVDHILGNHDNEHFSVLDVVDLRENTYRAKLIISSETKRIQSMAQCKPFNVYKNGEFIFKCDNCSDAEEKFLKFEKIKIGRPWLSRIVRREAPWKKIYTFRYITEEPNLLKGEVWAFKDAWCQKNVLLDLKGCPKAISNMGRILTHKGKITRGNDKIDNVKGRIFSGRNVARLVHYAFSNDEIGVGEMVCHKDGRDCHPDVFMNDGSGRYSNKLGTFYIGTQDDNMKDLSNCLQRQDEIDQKKAFVVKNNGKVIGIYSNITHCSQKLTELYGEKPYYQRIHACLKKDIKKFYGTFTCNYI